MCLFDVFATYLVPEPGRMLEGPDAVKYFWNGR